MDNTKTESDHYIMFYLNKWNSYLRIFKDLNVDEIDTLSLNINKLLNDRKQFLLNNSQIAQR